MIGVGLYGDTKRMFLYMDECSSTDVCVCQDEVSNFSVFFF